jgi:hypothetical protein
MAVPNGIRAATSIVRLSGPFRRGPPAHRGRIESPLCANESELDTLTAGVLTMGVIERPLNAPLNPVYKLYTLV